MRPGNHREEINSNFMQISSPFLEPAETSFIYSLSSRLIFSTLQRLKFNHQTACGRARPKSGAIDFSRALAVNSIKLELEFVYFKSNPSGQRLDLLGSPDDSMLARLTVRSAAFAE